MDTSFFSRAVILSLRIIGYLIAIIGLSFLAKGCLNLIKGFAVPFGLSPNTLLILQIFFILLFGFVGILIIIHFFKKSAS